MFFPPLTRENLVENVGEVADNVEHFLFSQILIGHMWRVISEKQNKLGGSDDFLGPIRVTH